MAEFNNKDFEKYFEPLLEGARRLNQLLIDNIESLRSFGKVAEQNIKKLDTSKAEDVDKLNKELQNLEKTTEDLSKTQKEQVKVEKELTKQEQLLAKITKENATANAELATEIEKARIQRTEARKAAKEEAKEQLGLNDTYAQQRKRLAELTKSLINLRLEGKANTEVFEEQEKEFRDLFQAVTEAEQEFGRFQRQVGDYAKEAEEATRITEKLERQAKQLRNLGAAIVGVTAGSRLFNRAIRSNEESLEGFEAASQGVSAGIDAVLGSLAEDVNLGEIEEGVGFFESLSRISLGDAIDDFEKVADATNQLTRAQQRLNKRLVDNNGPVQQITKALGVFLQDVQTGIPQLDDFINSLGVNVVDATQGANISIQKLAQQYAEYDRLTQQADRSTLGLIERLRLSQEAAEAGEQAFETELAQLQAQIQIARTRAEELQNTTQERQARQELAELEVQLTQLITQQNALRIEDEERTAQLRSDIVQIQLDTLIDQFDNIKTVNERIIADERFTAAETQALLNETNEAFEKSVADQIKTIDELLQKNNSQLEKNGELITLEEALNDVRALNIDQQDEAILALGASEEITTRILELLREERTATQDLAEAQRDLNEARREEQELTIDVEAQNEAIRRISELRNQDFESFEEFEKAREQVIEDLERERLENEIESLNNQIEEREKAGQKTIDLEQQLNEKLLQLEKERFEEERELAEKAAQDQEALEEKKAEEQRKRIEETKELFDLVSDAITQANENRINQLDEQIGAIDQRTQQLRAAALEGNATATQSLAELDLVRAKAAQEKEKALRNQQRLEAASAILSAYTANVQSDSQTPVADTVRDTLLLKQLVSGLLPFFHGTDDTGTGVLRDQYGTITGYTHDNEMVLSKKDRGDFKNILGYDPTRQDLKEMALESLDYNEPLKVVNPQFENYKLIKEVKELNNTVESLKMAMPKYDVNWNKIIDGITTRIKRGNTTDIKHEANGKGGVFG